MLVKGGRLAGDAVDVLFDGESFQTFETPRLRNRNTHGTGCAFSAALATFLGQGLTVSKAVGRAKKFITRTIESGFDLDSGHGPTIHYTHVIQWRE